MRGINAWYKQRAGRREEIHEDCQQASQYRALGTQNSDGPIIIIIIMNVTGCKDAD